VDVVWAFARAEARRARLRKPSLANQALPPVLHAQGGVEVLNAFYAGAREPFGNTARRPGNRVLCSGTRGLQVDGRTRAFFIASLAVLGLDGAYQLIDRFLFAAGNEHWSVDLSDLWLPRNADVSRGSALRRTGRTVGVGRVLARARHDARHRHQ